jgi:ribosomal protein S18 acetylase RimI-like enzyme
VATDADLAALWQLHVDTMRSYVDATYGWDAAVQEAMFRAAWPETRGQRLLVEGDVVVAMWRIEERAEDLYLAMIEVAPSHQGRGIGTELVRRLLERASAAGKAARLQVMKANPAARRLYERCGFLVERETATHHVMVAVR